ncbi:biliverdin-producing heme oxygenase [Streptomyces sp. WI04-05B]|uniref:biliverdin-producing heme oxygenase n=1 Tax=Streptomyces TaxID=1883 RepID=UPI0029A5E12D|nr:MULTISPECIES: biliverdin-producing heme oxygenase [unclassified Streptomyces]MDX2543850.1 biliverdin-producing heme oxygenase [Streptomyces sp. WI04-05B]MDX2582060.1 biliverdin-producing heme oxygenase [Streptomyces sp. WI04-05A]
MTAATVVERLRRSTRDWHDALEATPFAAAMVDGTLPVERYVGQLAAYRVVLGALESELAGVTDFSADRPVWSLDLVKLPLVERDLAHFANLGTLPGPWAADKADAFATDIRQRAADSDLAALLGYLYVMEGSTLGALFLHRYVTAAYHLPGTDGVAYYTSGDRDRWARFTARMNQAFAEPEAQDEVVAAARQAYGHVAAITNALSEGLVPAAR